ncbi:MAG: hypothetical protein ACRD1R_01380 [Acidobacteriota bacterium]
MGSVFNLSSFDEFELWLDGLVAHHRRPPNLFNEKKLVAIKLDFREDLRTSLQVVEVLTALCRQLAESEETEIRSHKSYSPKIRDFVHFWNFAEHYKVILQGLLRLPTLSRKEFKSVGFVLTEQVFRFKKSDACVYLRHKFCDWSCHQVIQRDLVSSIEMEGTREQLEQMLLEFLKTLSVIEYMREEMRRSFKYRKLMLLFIHCHYFFRKFAKLLEETAQYLDHYQPELADAIEATNLALKMETRRVFNRELREIDKLKQVDEIFARMQNALGLLQNAYQESLTHLLHLLNPDFDEFLFFDDLRRRYQESMVLLKDLQYLYGVITNVESELNDESWQEMRQVLRYFQESSMKFLYFKDWTALEQFGDELRHSSPTERPFVLHRLQVFLSTLIREVQKRSVLTKYEDVPVSMDQGLIGRAAAGDVEDSSSAEGTIFGA